MSHQVRFLQDVAELYWLLGHKVARITQRSNTTTDLVIISDRGDQWFVRCEYVHELDRATLERFIGSVQVEHAAQAAVIAAGHFKPTDALLIPENSHLLDGRLFRTYLHRARALAQAKTNPLVLALKRIAWKVSMQFVSRTFQPFSPEHDKPTRTATLAQPTSPTITDTVSASSQGLAPDHPTPAEESAARNRQRVRISQNPCPFCKRPFSGSLLTHFQFECREASKYFSNTRPSPPPMFKLSTDNPPEAIARPHKDKWVVVDEEGFVLSFVDHPDTYKR